MLLARVVQVKPVAGVMVAAVSAMDPASAAEFPGKAPNSQGADLKRIQAWISRP